MFGDLKICLLCFYNGKVHKYVVSTTNVLQQVFIHMQYRIPIMQFTPSPQHTVGTCTLCNLPEEETTIALVRSVFYTVRGKMPKLLAVLLKMEILLY